MRKNFGKKNWLVPQPVLIITTYDENGNANAMNAAWGGMYDEHRVIICLSTDHKTTQNLRKGADLVINFPTSEFVAEADYFGLASGNEVDNKIEKANLNVERAEFVDAPYITEFPLCLECKIYSLNEVEEGSTILVADIINASIDEDYLDSDEKPDLDYLDLILYDPMSHFYRKVGSICGKAFHDGLQLKK